MAKIGQGHVAAMGRLGLKELRNAVNPSREGVADNEIGLYGTLTQGEIATARGGPGSGPEQEQPARGKMTLDQLYSHAATKAQEAAHQMEHQNDHQRERGGREL